MAQTRPAETDWAKLKTCVEQEANKSEDEGYVPYRTRELLQAAQGQTPALASPLLLQAKGTLVDLKLPAWARELRYYSEKQLGEADPDRGVVLIGGLKKLWAEEVWPGQWYRGHCRPRPEAARIIEDYHRRGLRVGPYMSGGMFPITYALIPGSEDQWDTLFMRKYAGAYWEAGQRWWGATGDKPGWAAFMLPHYAFAAQVGFDFVHSDETWGAYPNARPMNERYPGFVMVTNNNGNTYIDQDTCRFRWLAMGEALGHPSKWDAFCGALRKRCLAASGVPIWNYLYVPDAGFYGNLAFATTLANKTTDVSQSSPSREFIRFSRQLADYLYGTSVDIQVDPKLVKIVKAPASARVTLARRTFLGGRQELVVHLFNLDPNVPSAEPVEIELDTSGVNLVRNPMATFVSPEGPAKSLVVTQKDQKLTFAAPGVKVWGLAIVGRPVFPQTRLRLALRQGTAPTYPLDNYVVPGEPFEVEAVTTPPLAPGQKVELHTPRGWTVNQGQTPGRYVVKAPSNCAKDHGYAITPIVHDGCEAMPSWPLDLEAKDPLTCRFYPPCIDSPSRAPTKVQFEAKSNGAGGTARVTLKAPEGWKVGQEQFELKVAPGQAACFDTTLWAPDLKVWFWRHKDAQVKVQWELEGTKGTASVGVRVFPAQFSIYHRGPEKRIMHSYPNGAFRGDNLEAAKKAVARGEYVVLWLVNQDPKEYGPIADWFLGHGAGVAWMGKPWSGPNCPVELAREEAGPACLYLKKQEDIRRDTPEFIPFVEGGAEVGHALVAPVRQFVSRRSPEKGFQAYQVKPKPWGNVLATWGDGRRWKTADGLRNAPAVVISTDPARRIVYVASDMATTSEEDYRFEDRWHSYNCWHLTYLYYNLLAWAAGTQ